MSLVNFVRRTAPGIVFNQKDAKEYLSRLNTLLSFSKNEIDEMTPDELTEYADPVTVYRVDKGMMGIWSLGYIGRPDHQINRTALCNTAYVLRSEGLADHELLNEYKSMTK